MPTNTPEPKLPINDWDSLTAVPGVTAISTPKADPERVKQMLFELKRMLPERQQATIQKVINDYEKSLQETANSEQELNREESFNPAPLGMTILPERRPDPEEVKKLEQRLAQLIPSHWWKKIIKKTK